MSCDICAELAWQREAMTLLLQHAGLQVPGTMVAAEYWNPSDKGADIVLSNSDKTAADPDGTFQSVRSVTSHSSGKYYAEVAVAGTTQPFSGIGLSNSSFSVSGFVGTDTNSVSYLPTQGAIFGSQGAMYENSTPAAYGAGTTAASYVLGIAVDLDNDLFYVSIDGTWQDSADPAAGTGGYNYSVTGALFVTAAPEGAGVTPNDFTNTLRTATADFSYTPPTGFSAWG